MRFLYTHDTNHRDGEFVPFIDCPYQLLDSGIFMVQPAEMWDRSDRTGRCNESRDSRALRAVGRAFARQSYDFRRMTSAITGSGSCSRRAFLIRCCAGRRGPTGPTTIRSMHSISTRRSTPSRRSMIPMAI